MKEQDHTMFYEGENRLSLLQLCHLDKEWQNSQGLKLLWCFATLYSSFMTQHFNFIAISISKLLMSSQSNMIYQRTTMSKNVKVVWYAEDDETKESHIWDYLGVHGTSLSQVKALHSFSSIIPKNS